MGKKGHVDERGKCGKFPQTGEGGGVAAPPMWSIIDDVVRLLRRCDNQIIEII